MDLVERWLNTYGPSSTRERYSTAITKFCAFCKATPEETLTWTLDKIEDRMIDWVTVQREADYAGSTITTEFAGVKRWFLFNRKRIVVECRNIPTTRKSLDYIPSRDDVQTLLDAAILKHRVAIALFAFAGLRPVDQSELVYENIKASLEAGDEVLTIVKQHRKTRQWYVTFLGPQGTGYLKRLLELRRKHGEKITDKTPILRSVRSKNSIQADSISKAIERTIKITLGKHPTREGFRRFRPYGLRKYFRRTVDKLGEAVAEYLMGHRQGLEGMPATYGGLRDLDPMAIAMLKRDYISILHELETEIRDPALREELIEKEIEQRKLIKRLDVLIENYEDLKKEVDTLKRDKS